MEATALSVGKSVLDGALGYAKSALAEEVALQLGVQRDHAFIRGELEMMQAFLKVAHDEHDNHEVLMTWVKQVRDVAYDAEDCLQDFSIHLHKPSSWWRLPTTLKVRRRIAKQMKELRARVEDVSQRNLRYQLIKSSGSKLTTSFEQSNITATTIFGVDDACISKVDLVHLIHQEGEDLKVIGVWGTCGETGQTFIINEAYENLDVQKKFPCRAWVRVLHPFNPTDFIHSLVKQFRSAEAEGIGSLLEAEKTGKELAEEFTRYVNQNRYLIVLSGLSTFEEWKGIRTCFPNNKKGSRIIVSTPQAQVASLCAGQESQVLKLKQLSVDQIIYVSYQKGCQDGTNSPMPSSSLNTATTSTINSVAPTNEILENQSKCGNERKVVAKSLTRIKTIINALEESQLIGRNKEISDMVKMISDRFGEQFSVISVWGMGGLGKTTLVKDVYQNPNLIGMFEKHAFVTVMRPFNLKELLKSLITQLSAEPLDQKGAANLLGGTRNKFAMMEVEALKVELAPFLRNKCLIVLDDLSSTAEWDMIIRSFPEMDKMEKISRIIVTTREKNIAKHCSEKQENIYILKTLEDNDAFDLFTRKVFNETIDWDKHAELMVEAKSILKKCNGLPLAIVTIGGFLANQPKTALEWRKLNDHISAELEINPDLEAIKTILSKSYDGLPYHLKSCFLYMSIFPEDHKVSRRRLIQRWTAEGYSREIREKPADEIADRYFMELIGRSMILPCQESVYSRNGIDSCQVHDLMREISITKSIEENLVLRLEEGSRLNINGAVRHLTVSSNWEGDKEEFEGAVDLSRIRSLTVFGKWRPFFMSDKMCLLRVLDLENTKDLVDHHLKEIGKLLHLKYLSLRGCGQVFHLPDSLGNLKQLQTLDVKGTCILKLPNTITNLRKLQYIYAGNSDGPYEFEKVFDDIPELLQNKICRLTVCSVFFCIGCCALEILDDDGIGNRRDVCNTFCCSWLPSILREQSGYGVALPRGLRKLRALNKLSTVDITVGKHILKDIKSLAQLHRLGVTGINKKNCREFCSTLDDLNNLESLTLHSAGEPGLHGCLDGVSSPPKSLQSLKLVGSLVELPGWIEGLHNLVKLKLEKTKLSELDITIQVLGKLPNLIILRLLKESFEGEKLHLTFHGDELFRTLTVLQLDNIDALESVEFEEGATPMLELLQFHIGYRSRTSLSGLSSLPSLKELVLEGRYAGGSAAGLQEELARNPNKPVLKRV